MVSTASIYSSCSRGLKGVTLCLLIVNINKPLCTRYYTNLVFLKHRLRYIKYNYILCYIILILIYEHTFNLVFSRPVCQSLLTVRHFRCEKLCQADGVLGVNTPQHSKHLSSVGESLGPAEIFSRNRPRNMGMGQNPGT